MSRRLLSVGEFVEEYRVSRSTLYRWLKAGELHSGNGARRVGRRLRIDKGLFDRKFVQKFGELVAAFVFRWVSVALILHHFCHGYLRGRLV